jgi:hypothetical protein
MDINILVELYERQRAQSTGISTSDVNHTLCMPMGIHIGMITYTQACLASTSLSTASRLPTIGTPTDRSLCHPCTINGFNRIVTFRTTFVEPVYGRQRPQPIDISEPRCRTL